MSKENKKTKIETKKSKRFLRCILTDIEKLQAGKNQADKAIEKIGLENEAKRISAEFKAKIAGCDAELAVLANKISSGYEHRQVTCVEYLGTPAPDKKRVVREDTLEEVGIEDMNAAEMQRELINTENEGPQ